MAAHLQASHQKRADEILAAHLLTIHRHTDRLFAVLFVVQWVFAIVSRTGSVASHVDWRTERSPPPCVGGICHGRDAVDRSDPDGHLSTGTTSTRMVIAVAQVLYSGLLIHLTGGRIETHFHIFGSLAVMAFYAIGTSSFRPPW